MRDNLNLTPERGPNVWNRQAANPSSRSLQLGGGIAMLAAGAAAAFFGGRMLYRVMRSGPAAGFETRDNARNMVDDESAQSFPASDAPSWTSEGATPEKQRPH